MGKLLVECAIEGAAELQSPGQARAPVPARFVLGSLSLLVDGQKPREGRASHGLRGRVTGGDARLSTG
jgi:hypothetical protein